MSHQSLINEKSDPIPAHPPTFPARPIRGGKLELAPKKSGVWFAEPKYNGLRALVHTPTGAMWIIGELQALFARHNAGAALSAKAVFKPTKEFHTARHTLYSAEENMEIDKVVPVAASVKTKLGRGGTGED